jgi:Zinc carboxypeptidase
MHARLLGALALVAALFVAAPSAYADVDPPGCTPDLQYDPSIPKYSDVLGAALGAGSRRPTLDLQTYQRAVVNATQNNPRVRVIEKKMSDTALGREVWYSVVSTPDNIANLDAGRNDAAFWSGVREGNISTAVGLSQIRTRPAFAWVTATPHGNEPAAGEASMRLLYEMAARMDCSNARRLQNITSFIVPATNPDGRDLNTRTTAWGFDPNRDRGTRVNMENDGFTDAIVKYPGVFVIDAHQQTNGYFFPPNEDAVHHEVSQFAIDFIQNDIGPMLQRMFNDQTVAYQNYNVYDLFAPIYGDSVPALLDGAAGMTYEKGSTEIYGKQVYDHYLAMDATENITSDQKVQILDGWVRQWGEARQQGAECQLQMNKLVSPLHTQIFSQPDTDVCGYFFQPNQSAGDTARLIGELTSTGVHVYKLDTAVNVAGVHPFGKSDPRVGTQTLPAGTLYVPMAQGQKHWIQAILGEDPYLPYPYNYDVTQWSYPLTRGIAGSGFLTQPFPPGVTMTEITDPALGTVSGTGSPVYAFDTDSAQALGMTMELLAAGVKVSRAGAAFTAGGRTFKTGAGLVDASTLGTTDLVALAKSRQTPVTGLPAYPTARFELAKPKIGLYYTAANPQNPAQVGGAAKGACSGGYCEALFVLTQKMKVPASLITPVSATEVGNGKLVADSFTAFINPASAINLGAGNVITPTLQGIQNFVNAGGRYIGAGTNGTAAARNAGLTLANTQAISGLSTPGSLYDGVFDTTSPLSWAYDSNGWIYRDLGGNANYDPATLVAGGAIPAPKVAGRYGAVRTGTGEMYKYGFDVNARGATQLAGRAAMIDQPFGSGRALLIGVNPFYRAWIDGEERLVGNGILYPTTAAIPPSATPKQAAAIADEPASRPVPAAKLPAVKSRPDAGGRNTIRDLRVVVKRSQSKTLKAAVKQARLAKHLRAKVRYTYTAKTATLVMRNVRSDDPHARNAWVVRIMDNLAKHKVRAISAQV